MAYYVFDPQSGNYHIRFRWAGKPYKRSLRLEDEGEFDTLDLRAVQRYADARAKEGVGRETVKKELATLRVIWG